MKLKSLIGKFVRLNNYGVAHIMFIKNIYKKDYQAIIEYFEVIYNRKTDYITYGVYETSYSEFQKDGIVDEFTKNKFDMNFSQEDSMRYFIQILFNQ